MKNKSALVKTLKWAIPIYIGCLLGFLTAYYLFDSFQSMSLPLLIITSAITFSTLAIPIYFKNTKE